MIMGIIHGINWELILMVLVTLIILVVQFQLVMMIIVACGARENDDNGDKSGHVGVFEFSNGSWEQLGGYIVGDSASATSGFSVSISGDGTIVAIGAPASSDYLGKVRVYQFSNGSWNQIGNDYNGTSSNGQFGNSVSLNNTGSIVAIGSPIASVLVDW